MGGTHGQWQIWTSPTWNSRVECARVAIGALYQLRPVAKRQLLEKFKDTLAEWLRRRPAKPMGSPRVGSNPIGVVFLPSFVLGPGAEGCTSHHMIFYDKDRQSKAIVSVLSQSVISLQCLTGSVGLL